MAKIEKELKEAVKIATTSFKQANYKELILKAESPVKVGVTFLASHFADVAELLPMVNRIDGLKVEYEASNMIEAYKAFELLALAARGVTALLADRK